MGKTMNDSELEVARADNGETNYSFFAALGYIPLLGWTMPMYLKNKNEGCRFHARQSAFLNGFFAALIVLVYLFYNLPYLKDFLGLIRFNEFITPALLYISIILFIGLSITAAYKARVGKKWQISFLKKFTDPVSAGERK